MSATSAADQFTYLSSAVVSSVSPASGPTSGSTSVTIGGTNLSAATAVHFGSATAAIVTDTASSLVATAPAGAAGTVDVTIATVTITGTSLSRASLVSLGTTPAVTFTVSSPIRITATAPTGTGTVDLTLTTPDGTSAASSADQFTYVAAPTVTPVARSAGPTGGGTSVITGTNLLNASAVRFGAAGAVAFTVESPTQITAPRPAALPARSM
jgi:hypothetical protein